MDGLLDSDKYEGSKSLYYLTHMMVFANWQSKIGEYADDGGISGDRLDVQEITDELGDPLRHLAAWKTRAELKQLRKARIQHSILTVNNITEIADRQERERAAKIRKVRRMDPRVKPCLILNTCRASFRMDMTKRLGSKN